MGGIFWKVAVGRPSGVLARLDLFRSIGLGHAVHRLSQRRRWETPRPTPRNLVYEAIWREAAEALGAEVVKLSVSMLEIRRGDAVTRVSHHVVPLDDPEVARSIDKTRVHGLLRASEIPVPDNVDYAPADPSPALAFIGSQPGAFFVKPATGTGAGWGVTGSVHDRRQLLRATLSASRYAPRTLVEREVEGDVYRLLFLDGELLDVVRRRLPTIVGDGRSTIRQLIERENERRIAARGSAGLWLLRIDLDSLFTLKRDRLHLRSVPPRFSVVTVKSSSGENRPEDNETVDGSLAHELVHQAATAVRLVGLRLAGVDLVTPDATEPLAEGRGAILEINGNPGLSHHYHVADRSRATRVAIPILERCWQKETSPPDSSPSTGLCQPAVSQTRG